MSNFFRFLISKGFWISILFMILISAFLVWFTMYGLDRYTHHGESITVPDLKGLTVKQVEQHLSSKALRFTIMDSSYTKDLPPLAVLDQSPKANQKVKEDRRIYLTVNAKTPPLVAVPDLIDASLRNAEIQLQSMGLERGSLSYEPDLAKNAVLEMKLSGKHLDPGTKLPKGTAIDLVLGNGIGNTRIEVPNLVGMTFRQSKLTIMAYQLNLGSVVMEGDIQDVENSIVYMQSPDVGAFNDRTIAIGEPIDLFLHSNPELQILDFESVKTTSPPENQSLEIEIDPNSLPSKEEIPVVDPLKSLEGN